MEDVILFKNGQKIAVLKCLEATMPKIRELGKSAFKDNYENCAEGGVSLKGESEMVPNQNFWIGLDLCREAYIEQFQKQNRALLTGTFIGAIK